MIDQIEDIARSAPQRLHHSCIVCGGHSGTFVRNGRHITVCASRAPYLNGAAQTGLTGLARQAIEGPS